MSRARLFLKLVGLGFVVMSGPACTPSSETDTETALNRPAFEDPLVTPPPPMPSDVQSVTFSDVVRQGAGNASRDGAETTASMTTPYWGIAPGDPLPIMWDDLMPEGSEEELLRQQAEFYRMLEKRYMATSSRLADATPFESIEEGSELDFMPQLGTFDIVEELDGQLVRIPGYVVPFDFDLDRRHEAFLLVPYMGACIHTPPPPPNQIIYIRADPAVRIKDIWVPYWIEGDLKGEEVFSDTGDAAYSLTLSKIEEYPVP